MSSAVENRPPPINTKIPTYSGAVLTPSINLPTPKTGDFALKSPALLLPAEFETIKSKDGPEIRQWKSIYWQAYKSQKLLELFWKTFRDENLKRQSYSEKDVKSIKKNHDRYIKYSEKIEAELAKNNDAIEKLNKKSGQDLAFGKVKEKLATKHPCLLTPGDWDTLQLRPGDLSKIAAQYSLGYSLQLLFNRGLEDPESFNAESVKKIAGYIEAANDDLELSETDDFGCMIVPEPESKRFKLPADSESESDGESDGDSDDESDGENDNDEEMGDGPQGLEERPPVPSDIEKIREEMGGDGGLLQKVLLDMNDDNMQIQNADLKAEFDKKQAEIHSLSSKHDLSSSWFEIKLANLKLCKDGMSEAEKLWNEIKNDPGNKDKQEAYQQLRKQGAEFMEKHHYPANYLDAVVPSIQHFIDAHNAGQGTEPPKGPPPKELFANLNSIIIEFGGSDGCLSKYLYTTAKGKSDPDAQAQVNAISEKLLAACGNFRDAPELQYFKFDQEKLRSLVNIVEPLVKIEASCIKNPSLFNTSALEAQVEEIELDYPAQCEILIGDVITSKRYLAKSQTQTQVPNPNLISELENIMKQFGDQNGCLSTYLHSAADGEPDNDAQRKVQEINDAILAACQPDSVGLLEGDGALSRYFISPLDLEGMVKAVKGLKALEKACLEDRSMDNIRNLGAAFDEVQEMAKSKHPLVYDAVLGDIKSSQRFLGNASSERPTMKRRVIPAPPAEPEPSHSSYQSNPRVVTEIVNGEIIEKTIIAVKKISRRVNVGRPNEMSAIIGWYLLLKYHDTEKFAEASYEMVAANTYPGSAQAFLDDGGAEFVLGTIEDLRGVAWGELAVRAVMPYTGRDPDREYSIAPPTLMMMEFLGKKKFLFFYISLLRTKFGAKRVNEERDDYTRSSGQKLRLPLTRAKERKKLLAEIEKLKDEKLQIALGKAPKRRPIVEEIEVEEVEDGEDLEEEDGDLEDFVVPDGKDSEEVANINSELLFLNQELKDLQTEESITKRLMQKKTGQLRADIKADLVEQSRKIDEVKKDIEELTDKLKAFKETENSPKSKDRLQLEADINDAKKRGQKAKQRILEGKLAKLVAAA